MGDAADGDADKFEPPGVVLRPGAPKGESLKAPAPNAGGELLTLNPPPPPSIPLLGVLPPAIDNPRFRKTGVVADVPGDIEGTKVFPASAAKTEAPNALPMAPIKAVTLALGFAFL